MYLSACPEDHGVNTGIFRQPSINFNVIFVALPASRLIVNETMWALVGGGSPTPLTPQLPFVGAKALK